MTPEFWVGKLLELRDARWRKPQQVRIDDAELATGVCNHQHFCRFLGEHVWYWARYA